jgi:hypothetical protein
MRCNVVLFITTEKIGGRTAFVSSFTVKMIKLKKFSGSASSIHCAEKQKTSKP